MSDNGMKAVVAAIRKNRCFVVSSHINPEGDALGSALSLASLLKRLGKQVIVANDGGIPKPFEHLPRLVPVVKKDFPRIKADVAITVDVPVLDRVGAVKPLLERIPFLVCIDHHISNKGFADINWIDPKAAAVGEMVYRLYKTFKVKPTKQEAYCMYVSLVTDTGSFRYMNTTPVVHQYAAELIATGVSPLEVSQHLYESRSPMDLKFLGALLKAIRVSEGGRVVWLEVPRSIVKSYHAGSEVMDELVNFPRSVLSAEVAFVLKESSKKGIIRVSFRSKGRVDVDKIARQFGGGGHMAASGCTFHGTIAEARGKVLSVVRKAIKEYFRE